MAACTGGATTSLPRKKDGAVLIKEGRGKHHGRVNFLDHIPINRYTPTNQPWKWNKKEPVSKGKRVFQGAIFHSYVSKLEGNRTKMSIWWHRAGMISI